MRLSAVPLAIVLALLAVSPAAAADYTVNRTDDVAGAAGCPQVCTLRNAVNGSQDAANTITVPAGTYTLTSSITIPKTITINGAGATATTITGNNTFRIFSVAAENRLFLSGVTVTGGNATTDTANPYGGNILAASGSWLVVANSRITGGSAPSGGGGIALRGALIATFSSSVIDNNTTTGSGGGILAQPTSPGGTAGALGLADSTVAFNTASTGGGIASRDNASAVSLERVTVADNRSNTAPGGGLFITPAQANFTVKSSIVARNSSTAPRTGVVSPSNCAPTAPANSGQNVESGSECGFTNGSQNADAGLAPQLATINGTYVLPLLAGSPAIDRAIDCGTGTQDQTGTKRPVGAACDSGAFEYIPPPPEPTPTATPAPQPTVAPPPTPTASPTPTPTPVYGKTVVAGTLSGTILVRDPESRTFRLLPAVQAIKVGATVDARKGIVTLTSVPKAGGKPETAKFYAGMFKVTQAGGITTLTLNEPLAPCAPAKSARAAAKKPKTRKLWGDGKGKFRTKGQYSAATIRGTKWLVQDGCRYTRTTVAIGVVSVRDDVAKRTIILRKNKSYTARPRR
ncbi:MAG TPA: choice-of-anchor Q domain-containing protein [Solirubrobacter sp.]